MHDLHTMIGLLAGAMSLLGFVPYTFEILRGTTRPNRATWWIWTVVGGMLCSSYYASGARQSVWVPVSYVVGPFITACLSLKYGEGGWTSFDRGCLAGSVVSAAVWWLVRAPMVTLIANIAIDFLGALPTVCKSYTEPQGESLLSWSLFLVADLLNLWAIEHWSIAVALYPLYLTALAACLTILLGRSRFNHAHAPGTSFWVRRAA